MFRRRLEQAVAILLLAVISAALYVTVTWVTTQRFPCWLAVYWDCEVGYGES